MGNRLSLLEYEDIRSRGPEAELAFYKSVDLKFARSFFSHISENMLTDFDVNNVKETVSWRSYLKIFCTLKDKRDPEIETVMRSTWHPCTLGYVMKQVDDDVNDEDGSEYDHLSGRGISDSEIPADDYTDDDGSVVSASERDESSNGSEDQDEDEDVDDKEEIESTNQAVESSVSPVNHESSHRKGWNSAFTNPIFFGYSMKSIAQHEKDIVAVAVTLKELEERAVVRTRVSRGALIDSFELASSNQESNRLKKIQKVESVYDAARSKRELLLKKTSVDLPPISFRAFKSTWEREYQAAEDSFEAEVGKMRDYNRLQCLADKEVLATRREELEAFRDAESQDRPSADRLEDIARFQLALWIDETVIRQGVLEGSKTEFVVMRGEYDEAQRRGATARELQSLRSVMNVTETGVREGQKGLKEALEGLDDSEILLRRAARIKQSQVDSLPLFRMLCGEGADVVDVRLDLLVCAVTALMDATYDQKCAFFFNLFDTKGEGFYSGPFLLTVAMLFGEMFYRIELLPQSPGKEDVQVNLFRAFRDLGLDYDTDSLSLPETKRVLITLLSQSCPLADTLAVRMGFAGMKGVQDSYVRPGGLGGGFMGTYQRNTMTAVGALLKGMIGATTCKYRTHIELTKFRPQLEISRKQIIHERALGQGGSDPLKTDYSRYFNKSRDKGEKVQPLDLGHLQSVRYHTQTVRVHAAECIQSMIRARFGRKAALIAAKKQAYREAKDAAIREMKERVLKEFKKKEATTGASKMKWDAQVKMRQSKLMAAGQKVGRSNTVMLMMDESMDKAKADLLIKFAEIEERENLTTFDFGGQVDVLDDISAEVENMVVSLFGIHFDLSTGFHTEEVEEVEGDEGVDYDDDGGDENEYHDGQSSVGQGSVGGDSTYLTIASSHLSAEKASTCVGTGVAFTDLQLHRFRMSVLGKYSPDPSPLALGEALCERTVRMAMAYPEPFDESHLLNRLRAADSSITLLKASGVLLENPTKRLLLKYIEAAETDEALELDLTGHFKLVRRQKEFVDFLRSLVESDMERGGLMRSLKVLEELSESGLRSWFTDTVTRGVNALSNLLDRRLLSSEYSTEEEVLCLEESRVEGCVVKFNNQANDIIHAIQKLRERSKRVLLSQQQVQKKLLYVRELRGRRYGQYLPPALISVADRHNWLLRYCTALKGSENTEAERDSKYEEIRAVCSEFLTIASADALIILSETFLPPFSKTIPISKEYPVHGRSMVSGRGHDRHGANGGVGKGEAKMGGEGSERESGVEVEPPEAGPKHYTYELHNIIYTVIEDHNGIFNGSDDFAMKAAGNDRLGSLEFAKIHVSRIQVPLTATIDFFGFRVLAVSKLPSERVLYSPEGEIRRVTEEQVHGLLSNGDYFVNKSRELQGLLEGVARQLNLAQHICQGLKDVVPRLEPTFISAETTVYKDEGVGGEEAFGSGNKEVEDYYLKDFWRTFPPEIPEETPHLTRAPRDQSIFWRLLRPELVRNWGRPLNPDAGCLVTQRNAVYDEHYDNLCQATRSISQQLVPHLMEILLHRNLESHPLPLSEGHGLDLAKELHCRGINVRHLGLARSLLFRPLCGQVNIYFHDTFLRTSRDQRKEVRNGERVRISGPGISERDFIITETDTDKITHDRLPISFRYSESSVTNASAIVGAVSSDKNSAALRSIFLAEIVARCLKSILRLQLRNYSKNIKGVSTHFKGRLLIEYFNVVTGSNPQSNLILNKEVFETITERFGLLAVLPSERGTLQLLLEPCIIFVIKRLQAMMGLQLSMACLAAFHENPVGFTFCDLDFVDMLPVVRHNMLMYPYSEAMTALLAAQRAERDTYRYQVLADGATVFLRLCERRGCRTAENSGSLGKDFQAHYNRGSELERPGPERADPFSRSAGFQPGVLCALDTKFHPGSMLLGAENHFSVEMHAMCTGGTDTLGTALTGGRFGITVTRENCWSFQLHINQYVISLQLDPVELDRWVYVAATFDGVTVRCYMDSKLCVAVEIAEPLRVRKREEKIRRLKSMSDLDGQEKREIAILMRDITDKVKSFFNSKEGVIKIKKMTRDLLDDPAFHERDFGFTAKEDLSESGIAKVKKSAANKEAKRLYTKDIFERMSRELRERYKQLRSEIVERSSKEDSEGELRVRQPIRVGAAHSTSTSLADTVNNFTGCIGLVAAYPLCLSADRVRAHFLAAHSGKAKEAQRLYALTSSKYEDALQFAHNDPLILKGYARTLCAYLRAEHSSQLSKQGSSSAKLKIMEAIAKFTRLNLPEGIGEILLELPREPEFAGIMSFGFLSMTKLDPSFFSRGTSLTRRDMVVLPKVYGLDHPRSPLDYIAAAGGMYKEVCRDFELRMSYGEVDLSWLSDITSPELVIALVRNAQEDGDLRVFNVGEMYRASGRSECLSSVTDADVIVLGERLLLAQVFDLAGCHLLTDLSVKALIQCQLIRAVNFDSCSLITDAGLQHMLVLAEGLQVLSLAGLTRITDEGLNPIFSACHRLKVVCVDNCAQITGGCLEVLAANNKLLTTFSAAGE